LFWSPGIGTILNNIPILSPTESTTIAKTAGGKEGFGEFEGATGGGELGAATGVGEGPSFSNDPEYAFGPVSSRLTTNNTAPRNIKPALKIDFFMG